MDLFDLRAFIASQKAQLQQEREVLVSQQQQRGLADELGTSKEFLLSRYHTEETTKPSSKDEIHAAEVSDALCRRINDLNSFRNQVVTQAQIVNDFEIVSENSTQAENDGVLVDSSRTKDTDLYQELLPEKKQFSAATSLTVLPDLDEKNPLLDNTLKDGTIQELKPCTASTLNRDKEIERLQEKFSSAPFWDSFGKSATSQKWNSNGQETMVRVGEFSPANPDLQAPGKGLLGLGEYEDRRRQLLEKKKLEYKEYLSQTRNCLQRTDHLQHHTVKSNFDVANALNSLQQDAHDFGHSTISVDAATQTENLFIEQSPTEFGSLTTVPAQAVQSTLSVGEPSLHLLSPRVTRAHSSQTTEQLPDARMRQLQLQGELRLQIEEKRRLEMERREQERIEEEALQRRVAEQQARLQAEYERDEKLRREREIQKQQQIEDFQRRQEELRAESEALKLERRQKLEAAHHIPSDPSKGSKHAHLVPPSEPAPLSILKSTSPPLRSPRREARGSQYSDDFSDTGPPSPRALIKVLEGPTLPKRSTHLEDSLPIPLMPTAHSRVQPPYRSSQRSPRRSPHVSPRRSPRRSPSRFVCDPDWALAPAPPHLHPQQAREPSDAMRNLEERWKVPAVQKNVCVRGKPSVQDSNTGNVLTQLGAFRRQLQMEHMRMEEKVREKHQPHQYHQRYYQQHVPQQSHYN